MTDNPASPSVPAQPCPDCGLEDHASNCRHRLRREALDALAAAEMEEGIYDRVPAPVATEHELKVWPIYFGALLEGRKRFELRKNDRGFREGDTLYLREWNPWDEVYTGETMRMRVDYLVQGKFGLPEDVCVMSVSRAEPSGAPQIPADPEAEIRCILASAVDRLVDNESVRELAILAANGIYWRNRRITELEAALAAERERTQALEEERAAAKAYTLRLRQLIYAGEAKVRMRADREIEEMSLASVLQAASDKVDRLSRPASTGDAV